MGIAGLFGGPHPGYRRPLTRLAAPVLLRPASEPVNGQAAILGVEDLACFVAANQVRYALIGATNCTVSSAAVVSAH